MTATYGVQKSLVILQWKVLKSLRTPSEKVITRIKEQKGRGGGMKLQASCVAEMLVRASTRPTSYISFSCLHTHTHTLTNTRTPHHGPIVPTRGRYRDKLVLSRALSKSPVCCSCRLLDCGDYHTYSWGLTSTATSYGWLGGGVGGEDRYRCPTTYPLQCRHQNNSALRWAAVWAILMFH